MTKTKGLLIAAFVVTFAAGAVAGLLAGRAGHRRRGPSYLAAELDLTDPQRHEMHEIWSEVMHAAGRRWWEQHKALREQRDQAIVDLLTDAQRAEYERILADHAAGRAAIDAERKQAFDRAVERTKAILTPEQAAKYEDLLQRRPERDRGRGDRRGPPPPPWGKPTRRKPHEKDTNTPSTSHGGSNDGPKSERT